MLRISTQTFLGSHHLSHCVDRPRRRRNVLRIPPNTTQAVGRYSHALSQVDVSVVIRRHHVDRPKMTPIVYATHQVDEIQCQLSSVVNKIDQEPDAEDEANNIGVKAALSMLKFYKREISPLLPKSCRYVPSCSEYSMIAYKKYGFVKGTVLTTWRLCRCNPLGGSGFDPPRWFDEERVAEE